MITIREMTIEELDKLAEIDRSEHVTILYKMVGGQLTSQDVDIQVPNWKRDGKEHSVENMIQSNREICLQHRCVLLGAFDKERLAGIAILRYDLTEDMAQLALLHVSRTYRRQGIARKLSEKMFLLAKADGAKRMYVSATESNSAVGFYTSQGFEVTDTPHAELLALEPYDIHMIKIL
jgi:ribosomal protein S18 acetylase RimI-like enzyme